MIRLKDVAARAGVSLMTVSKVLRDAPDVSPATKSRIRWLVQEMGYVPDALARGLRTRRTKLLGVVVPSVGHPVAGDVVGAIENRVHELGYDLLLAQSQDNPQREDVCLRRLLSRRVDGLFIHPIYRLAPTAAVWDELLKSGTPVVLLGPSAPFCAGFTGVETDDVLAGYHVAQHLIRLGHERIAFFAGPPAAPWAQELFAGYRRALREAGLPLDDRLVFSAGVRMEDGQRSAVQMLSEGAAPTAIQTVSDDVALGVATVLWERGLRLPEDLSLAGYGDLYPAEWMRVSLTTVRLPRSALGAAAVEAMERLLGGEKVESRRLPGELCIRGSTAGPARARRAARPTRPADPVVDQGGNPPGLTPGR
jgi:LacI family transcriptional regulator